MARIKSLKPWHVAVSLAILVALAAAVLPRASGVDLKANGENQKRASSYAATLSQAFRNAADQVMPSVVTIYSKSSVAAEATEEPDQALPDEMFKGTPFEDLFRDPNSRKFFKQYHSPQVPREQSSMGSGVIIDPSGVILTNNHVVAGGGKIMVRLHDDRQFEATDVKTDPRTDLAVIRIKGAGPLKAAKLGDSDAMQIGDWVLAVGNPFGLSETVTAGIISAKGRGLRIAAREDFLQTDAAINPGNSGGPLINLDGEVVGINTAISSQTGAYQGAGFAIPSNMAKWVSQQLIERGSVQRAYLGVGIQEVTPDLAKQFGVKSQEGALVGQVFPDSPGAKAGLKPGDVIVEFAGKPVANPRDLQAAVERIKAGQKEPVVVLREGKRVTLDVTVLAQPTRYGMEEETPGEAKKPEGTPFKDLGIEVGPLSSEVAEQLNLKNVQGVVITSVKPNSPADMAGLSASMVITQVGSKPVKSVEDFRAAMKDRSLEKGVALLVRTPEGSRFVVISAR
ncbi:MAG: DegQ family serine endoprotease [Pirellulales bacterium]